MSKQLKCCKWFVNPLGKVRHICWISRRCDRISLKQSRTKNKRAKYLPMEARTWDNKQMVSQCFLVPHICGLNMSQKSPFEVWEKGGGGGQKVGSGRMLQDPPTLGPTSSSYIPLIYKILDAPLGKIRKRIFLISCQNLINLLRSIIVKETNWRNDLIMSYQWRKGCY